MEFATRVENSCTVVSLSGRLDTVTAPDCDRKFHDLLADNFRVVVDFAGVDYISSAGLRSVLLMERQVREKNGRICLANLGHNVRTVFDISGIGRIFECKDSVDEAIAAVS